MRILFAILSLLSFSLFGQVKKERIPSYFGLGYRYNMPTNFIGQRTTELDINQFQNTLKHQNGFAFGAIVRAGLTKTLAIETGLGLTRRNFDIEMALPDSNVFATTDLRFLSYDIPISMLIYIQLSDEIYMNTALGGALCYNPTNVGVKTITEDGHIFRHTGLGRKVAFELGANVGFEYRTKKDGFIYLGGAARLPVQEILFLKAEYQPDNIDIEGVTGVDAGYMSIELKYFFPIIKNKGPQFNHGPIDQ